MDTGKTFRTVIDSLLTEILTIKVFKRLSLTFHYTPKLKIANQEIKRAALQFVDN